MSTVSDYFFRLSQRFFVKKGSSPASRKIYPHELITDISKKFFNSVDGMKNPLGLFKIFPSIRNNLPAILES